MTLEKSPRLRIAPESCRKFRKNLKVVFRQGRGRKLTDTIRVLNPKLRGWCNYFQYAACKKTMEELDGFFHCRQMMHRRWLRIQPKRRRLELIRYGIKPENAYKSAVNGFGPWWNAGADHMKQAFPKKFFDALELYSLLDATMERSISS